MKPLCGTSRRRSYGEVIICLPPSRSQFSNYIAVIVRILTVGKEQRLAWSLENRWRLFDAVISKMVNKHCFVSGCDTGKDAENGPTTVFYPPKDSLEKWKEMISKEGFGPKSRLCWRHFDEEDIDKGKWIGGQFYPHRWRLKKGVMPKHFLHPGIQIFSDFPHLLVHLLILYIIFSVTAPKPSPRQPLKALSTNQGK